MTNSEVFERLYTNFVSSSVLAAEAEELDEERMGVALAFATSAKSFLLGMGLMAHIADIDMDKLVAAQHKDTMSDAIMGGIVDGLNNVLAFHNTMIGEEGCKPIDEVYRDLRESVIEDE